MALSRTVLTIAEGGLVIALVRCVDAEAGWAPPEHARRSGVVLVRRGAFARRSDGVDALLDGTRAYFDRPGAEEQFAHPAGPSDECLAIDLSSPFLARLGRSPAELPAGPVRTTAAVDLAHRRLAREARAGGDEFVVYERTCRLVDDLLSFDSDPARPGRGTRPATADAHRRLAVRAREALLARPTISLTALAREVCSSPHHLSRVFSTETGLTLSAYRNRLRVGRALARLEEGELDLAGLAADLGFADHAHLTRVARAHLGEPPSRLRELLAPAN